MPPRLTLAELHGSVADPILDTMNFLNEVTARYPDAVSFAPGRPFDGLFDPACIAEYFDSYTRYLRRSGRTEAQVRAALFQYGRTKGQIHGLIAETVANDEGISVPPESVVVTVGAQEGMFLLLRVLMAEPADVLLASSPCYIGITGAARLLDVAVLGRGRGPGWPGPGGGAPRRPAGPRGGSAAAGPVRGPGLRQPVGRQHDGPGRGRN